jgi:hypothetical protein
MSVVLYNVMHMQCIAGMKYQHCALEWAVLGGQKSGGDLLYGILYQKYGKLH